MKRLLSFFSMLVVGALLVSSQAEAKDNAIHMNAAYWKGGSSFDVVVQETPHLKMKLYVNDKDPNETTVNNEGWATFRGVQLSGSGKISFTWVDDLNREYPINYTSSFSVSDPKATFADNQPDPEPAKPVTTPLPIQPTSAAPAPTPAPIPSTAPAPQSSANYKNCTEARAAGVTPIYRGQPGYAAHLDRDGDGIACE